MLRILSAFKFNKEYVLIPAMSTGGNLIYEQHCCMKV